MKTLFSLLTLLSIVAADVYAETQPPQPYGALPSERQLKWHEREFYGFLHFTTNTFTDREWGNGDEPESVFNPTAFDADQIVSSCKAAGMKGLILTCKHHDGFCLWPSKFTEHSVKNSPWKNGQGDVVKEIYDACRKHGLQFGVYLSPWDRNHKDYGRPEYVEYYRRQLGELLTNYGPIFEVWLDGANGGDGYYGGERGTRTIDRKTYYGWDTTWKLIRELQPDACIFSDVGPDVRWVGTEAGYAGDPCWATLNDDGWCPGDAPADQLNSGHRNGKKWIPAETDVSIRPGWFYHAGQDKEVRSPENLMKIYFESVGRGSNLLLNVPPDRRGLVHENDARSLAEFGRRMRETFAVDLAKPAAITASNTRVGDAAHFGPQNLLDADRATYWATDDDVTTPEVVFEFKEPVRFNIVRLREYLPLGQRVENYALDTWIDGKWQEFSHGTAIGSCRLVRTKPITTTKVRLRITKSPVCPAIAEFGLFDEPDWTAKPTASPATESNHIVDLDNNVPLACVKDSRTEIPMLTQPDHFVKTWQPVLVQPQTLARFPEELEKAILPSPDPLPAGLAWDGKSLWVAGRKTCKIYQIDPQTGIVLSSIPAPGELPTGLACDGSTVWLTDEKSQTVYGIENGAVTKKYVLDWPCAGIAVMPQGLIVSDSKSTLLRIVSPENGKVLDTVPAPDAGISGLAFDGTSLWCSHGDLLIVHDLLHKKPITTFAVSGRSPDHQKVSGLTIAKDRLWYADLAKGQLVNLPTPRHGQHIAAHGTEHDAVFTMSVRNASDRAWPKGAFLMNVPIYEMPGQRFLRYQITPEPIAHYRDSEGNLHALVGWNEVAPGESFQVTVRATLWSADRWTFIDPQKAPTTLSEPLQTLCAEKQGGYYPIDSDFILAFLKKSVGDECNPFWKFRLAHDAFVAQTTYVEPEDQSVAGVLEKGKGVCRHFSNVLVTVGRTLKVPVMDVWAPHHNLCCVWIHGAGWVFFDPTLSITQKRDTLLSSSLWSAGLPRDELTTGVGGPALLGDLLVDGVPFVPARHCRIPKDLPGFQSELEWMMKSKADKNNYQPLFFAMPTVRRDGEKIRLSWQEAVDVDGDEIEYLVEAKTEDGNWQEVGRTKEHNFGFTPKEKFISIRITANDGHHDIPSVPKAERQVPGS